MTTSQFVPTLTRSVTTSRREWLVPAGLITLAMAPSLTGVARLLGMMLGRPTLPDDERLTAHAVPLVLHIVTSVGFAVLGALQFAPTLRQRGWHRIAGRGLGPCGVASALSGMYLAVALPVGDVGSPLLSELRLFSGAAMLSCLILGLHAVRHHEFAAHGAWMTRAYAIGIASGTQFFTVLPYVLLCASPSASIMAALMGAGWAINLAVAEWSLRRRYASSSTPRAQLRIRP